MHLSLNHIKSLLLLALISTTSACSVAPNHHLSAQAVNKIASAQIIVSVEQKEIKAEIEQSNVAAASGGGLLFALIDVAVENSRANTAEKFIQPIKDALVQEDFSATFMTNISQELKDTKWLSTHEMVLNRELNTLDTKKRFEETNADTVLLIYPHYSIAADFSAMIGKATLILLPKNESLKMHAESGTTKKAKRNPLHIDNNLIRDIVKVSLPFGGTSTNAKFNAQYLAQKPSILKTRLSEVALKLAQEIKKNLLIVAPDKT